MDAFSLFILFSFSTSTFLHRLHAWKWHCCNPFFSFTLPPPFLHLRGPEGFVSVCSCQMPALCRPPPFSLSLSLQCLKEREKEGKGQNWGISLVPIIQPGWRGGCLLLCTGALSPRFVQLARLCVCVQMGLLLFSATAGILLNG